MKWKPKSVLDYLTTPSKASVEEESSPESAGQDTDNFNDVDDIADEDQGGIPFRTLEDSPPIVQGMAGMAGMATPSLGGGQDFGDPNRINPTPPSEGFARRQRPVDTGFDDGGLGAQGLLTFNAASVEEGKSDSGLKSDDLSERGGGGGGRTDKIYLEEEEAEEEEILPPAPAANPDDGIMPATVMATPAVKAPADLAETVTKTVTTVMTTIKEKREQDKSTIRAKYKEKEEEVVARMTEKKVKVVEDMSEYLEQMTALGAAKQEVALKQAEDEAKAEKKKADAERQQAKAASAAKNDFIQLQMTLEREKQRKRDAVQDETRFALQRLDEQQRSEENTVDTDTRIDLSSLITKALVQVQGGAPVGMASGMALRPTSLGTQFEGAHDAGPSSPTIQGQQLSQLLLKHSRLLMALVKGNDGGGMQLKELIGRHSNRACAAILDMSKPDILAKCLDSILLCLDGPETASRGVMEALGGMDAVWALDATRPNDDPPIHPIKVVKQGSIVNVMVTGTFFGVQTTQEGFCVFERNDEDPLLNGGFSPLSVLSAQDILGYSHFSIAQPLDTLILIFGLRHGGNHYTFGIWSIDLNGERDDGNLLECSLHHGADGNVVPAHGSGLPANVQKVKHLISGNGTSPCITENNREATALRYYNEVKTRASGRSKAGQMKHTTKVTSSKIKFGDSIDNDFIAFIGEAGVKIAFLKADGSRMYDEHTSSEKALASLLQSTSSMAGCTMNGTRYVLCAVENESILIFEVPNDTVAADPEGLPCIAEFQVGNDILDVVGSAEGGALILMDEKDLEVLGDGVTIDSV